MELSRRHFLDLARQGVVGFYVGAWLTACGSEPQKTKRPRRKYVSDDVLTNSDPGPTQAPPQTQPPHSEPILASRPLANVILETFQGRMGLGRETNWATPGLALYTDDNRDGHFVAGEHNLHITVNGQLPLSEPLATRVRQGDLIAITNWNTNEVITFTVP